MTGRRQRRGLGGRGLGAAGAGGAAARGAQQGYSTRSPPGRGLELGLAGVGAAAAGVRRSDEAVRKRVQDLERLGLGLVVGVGLGGRALLEALEDAHAGTRSLQLDASLGQLTERRERLEI